VFRPPALLIPPRSGLAQKLGEGRQLPGFIFAGARAERRWQTGDALGFDRARMLDSKPLQYRHKIFNGR
jgi:hypothetical protein